MHRPCKLQPMYGVGAYIMYTHRYTRQIRYFWKRRKYDFEFHMDFENVQYIGSLYRTECKMQFYHVPSPYTYERRVSCVVYTNKNISEKFGNIQLHAVQQWVYTIYYNISEGYQMFLWLRFDFVYHTRYIYFIFCIIR